MPHVCLSVCLCASLCISVSVYIFPRLLPLCVCVIIHVLVVLLFLCSRLWILVFPIFFFFGFIPVSLSDGRSSSQALKEEDVPALNPPQLRKGRFQVGEATDTLPHRGLSQVADDIPPRLVPSGHSGAAVLSPKNSGIGPEQYSQKNRALLRDPGGAPER